MTKKLLQQEGPESRIEYRIKVYIAHDLPNGLKAGDEFNPFDEPTIDVRDLNYSLNWWNTHGHKACIEVRSTRISHSAWEDE